MILMVVVVAMSIVPKVAAAQTTSKDRAQGRTPSLTPESTPPACAQDGVSQVPGGIVIRATSAPGSHDSASAAATERPLPDKASTSKLRSLAIMRAQWQPPPATTLTPVRASF